MLAFAFVLGVFVGAAALAALVVVVARSKMLVAEPLALGFDDAVGAIVRTVPSVSGWGMPVAPLDMHGALAAKGIAIEGVRRAHVFFLCNPRHAARVLGREPRLMGMMPCSWALYETDDGRTYLASMNMPLMSRLFAGEVGATLRLVASEEERMRDALRETSEAGAAAPASA